MTPDLLHISKKVAYLCRHSEFIQEGGWVDVGIVLRECNVDFNLLRRIVDQDDKGRFQLSDDFKEIRAIYGHSKPFSCQMAPSIPPAILYHGTASKNVETILSVGLDSKSRQFVHLTTNIDNALKTGRRHGEPSVLTVFAQSMCENGAKFFKANDTVWLTASVAQKYILPCIVQQIDDKEEILRQLEKCYSQPQTFMPLDYNAIEDKFDKDPFSKLLVSHQIPSEDTVNSFQMMSGVIENKNSDVLLHLALNGNPTLSCIQSCHKILHEFSQTYSLGNCLVTSEDSINRDSLTIRLFISENCHE